MASNEMEELERLKMKGSQVANESLESTRRMVQLVEESSDVAIKTIDLLNDQGEKLDAIEENMDAIHNDVREAQKNLTGMEKCCGFFSCPCFKSGTFKTDGRAWAGNEDGKILSSQPTRIADNRNGTGPMFGPIVPRIMNDAREDEMEENMQQVSSVLGNLKNMAIDMGAEMDAQNVQIDRINMKGQSNETHIENANARATFLLKN